MLYEYLWHRYACSNMFTFSRATTKSSTLFSARAIDFHFKLPPGRISFSHRRSNGEVLALLST